MSSAVILLWLGAFKFTQAEAEAIRPLIAHHPLTSWVYGVLSTSAVSSAVGIVEIAIALLLVLSLWHPRLTCYAAAGMIVVFGTTLSFLFTTPGMWRMVEGFPVSDFFIIKDALLLGFGLMLFDLSYISHSG